MRFELLKGLPYLNNVDMSLLYISVWCFIFPSLATIPSISSQFASHSTLHDEDGFSFCLTIS